MRRHPKRGVHLRRRLPWWCPRTMPPTTIVQGVSVEKPCTSSYLMSFLVRSVQREVRECAAGALSLTYTVSFLWTSTTREGLRSAVHAGACSMPPSCLVTPAPVAMRGRARPRGQSRTRGSDDRHTALSTAPVRRGPRRARARPMSPPPKQQRIIRKPRRPLHSDCDTAAVLTRNSAAALGVGRGQQVSHRRGTPARPGHPTLGRGCQPARG